MSLSIEEFYQHNQIDESFDEKCYLKTYPETVDFYQPHCQQNNIDDKHRLYFHYVNHRSPPNTNTIYLRVHHGLANRLRTINSFSKFASTQGKKLKIYWGDGPGWSDETFNDLFCSIKDERIEFIDKKAFHAIPSRVLNISDYISRQQDGKYLLTGDQEQINRNDFFYFGDACVEYLFSNYKDNSEDWFYGLLEPVESLILQIKKIQKKSFNTNNTIGLHIRRGDSQFVPFNELYNVSSDEMFCHHIDEEIHKDPNVRFYLSTDCKSTQIKFKNLYNKHIIYNENKKFVTNQNIFYKTKPYQSDAVIDMWLLSLTRKIIGTNFSSFSQVASTIGDISLEVVGQKEQKQIKNIDRQLKPSVLKIPNELGWQKPAFTEKQAFINHRNNYLCSSNQVYIAYPWATLIDKMNNLFYRTNMVDFMQDRDKRDYLIKNIVDKFQIESHKQTYTVCQHALWDKLITLWETMGINHVFVSHLTNNFTHDSQIKFYPWHLIGCNAENPKRNEDLIIKPTKQKKYLCSFVGCNKDNYRSNIRKDLHKLYLSKKNDQIYLDIYDEWFLEDIVHKNQIREIHIDTPSIEQHQFQVIKYNQLLSDSIFSLCPEGYGPNTIRLWESMSIGSIPVLFENDWVRPQIEGMDWDDFSITIRKTEFKDTFDILKCVSLSKIEELKINAINAYNRFRLKTCF